MHISLHLSSKQSNKPLIAKEGNAPSSASAWSASFIMHYVCMYDMCMYVCIYGNAPCSASTWCMMYDCVHVCMYVCMYVGMGMPQALLRLRVVSFIMHYVCMICVCM